MKARFGNRDYDVQYVSRPGEYDGEWSELARILTINTVQGDKIILETELHELLHAALNTELHAYIETAARQIADYLWRRGYRRK